MMWSLIQKHTSLLVSDHVSLPSFTRSKLRHRRCCSPFHRRMSIFPFDEKELPNYSSASFAYSMEVT
uniref:Uncharacterized protein n=1 Tax=Lepeophtheirus salmonis TaxID=72036 RepID=A0A0K2TRK1_LEPSM